jgi:hypothetical protein
LEKTELETFNSSLLKVVDNPFRYPHPPRQPPFAVGGEAIISWAKTRYQESIGQGAKISFIVGLPGAGKSHLLSHLEYLFYGSKQPINGVYFIYRARKEEITEKDIWISLFSNDYVLHRIKSISSNQTESFTPQTNIAKLLAGQLDLEALDTKRLHALAESLSDLLERQNTGICIAIDNLDEYHRAMTDEYSIKYGSEGVTDRVATNLLSTIRTLTETLNQICIFLACTKDVYDKIKPYASSDATYGRRLELQDRTLQTLSSYQATELVNKYLYWWAEKQGMTVPLIDEEKCYFIDSSGRKLSTYPFSIMAIEYFNKVTRACPGDIVCVCGQCINAMRHEQEVTIVEGASIFYALDEAKRQYPSLLLNSALINTDRHRYMADIMEKRVRSIIKEKPFVSSDSRQIIDSIKKYREALGITSVQIESVLRYRSINKVESAPEDSEIWVYKGKRIFVKYMIGLFAPLGAEGREFGYDKQIKFEDIVAALSFLDDDEVKIDHALFITRWCEPLKSNTWFLDGMTERFRPVLEEFCIDGLIGKIYAFAADTSDQQADLLNHVEKNYVHLLNALNKLVSKKRHEGRSGEADMGY